MLFTHVLLVCAAAVGLHPAPAQETDPFLVERFRSSVSADFLALMRPASYTVRTTACVFQIPESDPGVLGNAEAEALRVRLSGLRAEAGIDLSSWKADVHSCLQSALEAGLGRVNEHPHVVAYTPDLSLQSWGAAGQRMFHQVGPTWNLQSHEASGVVTIRDGAGAVLIHDPRALVGPIAIGQRGADEVRAHAWTRLRAPTEVEPATSPAGVWRREWEGVKGASLLLELDASLRVAGSAILAGDTRVTVAILDRDEGRALPSRALLATLTRKALMVEQIVIERVSDEVDVEDLRLPVREPATLRDLRKAGTGPTDTVGIERWPEDVRSLVRSLGPAEVPAESAGK